MILNSCLVQKDLNNTDEGGVYYIGAVTPKSSTIGSAFSAVPESSIPIATKFCVLSMRCIGAILVSSRHHLLVPCKEKMFPEKPYSDSIIEKIIFRSTITCHKEYISRPNMQGLAFISSSVCSRRVAALNILKAIFVISEKESGGA